jgi:hypothetical protein
MSAIPITTSRRYYQQGVSKVLWAPTIADIHAVTRAEINAAIDLSPEVSASAGWEVTSTTQATPALGTPFVGNIFATTTAADSSLTCYADATSVDVRTLLTRGLFGNVLWLGEGDVAGYLMDAFPVTVTSAPKNRTITATAEIVINFSIIREPAENITIPA